MPSLQTSLNIFGVVVQMFPFSFNFFLNIFFPFPTPSQCLCVTNTRKVCINRQQGPKYVWWPVLSLLLFLFFDFGCLRPILYCWPIFHARTIPGLFVTKLSRQDLCSFILFTYTILNWILFSWGFLFFFCPLFLAPFERRSATLILCLVTDSLMVSSSSWIVFCFLLYFPLTIKNNEQRNTNRKHSYSCTQSAKLWMI